MTLTPHPKNPGSAPACQNRNLTSDSTSLYVSNTYKCFTNYICAYPICTFNILFRFKAFRMECFYGFWKITEGRLDGLASNAHLCVYEVWDCLST